MGKKNNWNDTLIRLQQIHPTLDFSTCQPCYSSGVVTVKCPEHGEFNKVLTKLLNGRQGCPSCSKSRRGLNHRLSIADIVNRVAKHWGDRVTVIGDSVTTSNAKASFLCKDHGEFSTLLSLVYTGAVGCPKCMKAEISKGRLSKEEIIARLPVVAGASITLITQDLSATTKTVTGICSAHGEFTVSRKDLLRGRACNKCGLIRSAESKIKSAAARFKDRFTALHGDKYDLSRADYQGQYKRVIILCPEHGAFERSPANLLFTRKGKPPCPYCSGKYLCRDNFQRAVDERHGEGVYSCGEVTSSTLPVNMVCNTCGDTWVSRTPGDMINGYGRCLSCFPPLQSTFDKAKPGILYNIKFTLENGDVVYKVGITGTTVRERLDRMKVSPAVEFEILDYIQYEKGQDAYDQEQALHKEFAEFQYFGDRFLESGWTELFTVNPFTHKMVSHSSFLRSPGKG